MSEDPLKNCKIQFDPYKKQKQFIVFFEKNKPEQLSPYHLYLMFGSWRKNGGNVNLKM